MKRNKKTWFHMCGKVWRYSNRYDVCNACGKKRPPKEQKKGENGSNK